MGLVDMEERIYPARWGQEKRWVLEAWGQRTNVSHPRIFPMKSLCGQDALAGS